MPERSTRASAAVIDAYREQIDVVRDAGAAGDPDGLAGTGAGGHLAGGLPVRVLRTLLAEVDQPVILHWLGDDVRPGAARLLGQSTDIAAATATFRELIESHTPTRSTASRCRCSTRRTRSRCGGALPDGRPAVHRRRLQLSRADHRRRARAFRCAARHLRRDLPGGLDRAAGTRRGQRRRRASRSWTRPGRSAGTSSRRRRTTTRPGSRSCPGSTATSRASRWSAAWPRGRSVGTPDAAVRARRPGRPARRPRPGGAPDADRSSSVNGVVMTRLQHLTRDRTRLSLNTMTTKSWTLREAVEAQPRPGLPRGRAVARPGRRGRCRQRGEDRRATPACGSRACAAAAS